MWTNYIQICTALLACRWYRFTINVLSFVLVFSLRFITNYLWQLPPIMRIIINFKLFTLTSLHINHILYYSILMTLLFIFQIYFLFVITLFKWCFWFLNVHFERPIKETLMNGMSIWASSSWPVKRLQAYELLCSRVLEFPKSSFRTTNDDASFISWLKSFGHAYKCRFLMANEVQE